MSQIYSLIEKFTIYRFKFTIQLIFYFRACLTISDDSFYPAVHNWYKLSEICGTFILPSQNQNEIIVKTLNSSPSCSDVRVRQAVAGLSDKHQIVFILHISEDLSYKEIAEVVGCNVGTVMSRLFYARKKLQESLAAMGYKLS